MDQNVTSIKPTAEYDMYLENCVWNNLELPFVISFPSFPYYASHVVCLIYNVIQTLLTIVLNYLAVYAFWKSSQLRRKTTLFIVMVLSANDLAIGLVAEPLFLLHLSREIFGNENCFTVVLNVISLDMLMPISMMTFLVLNFEIYLSVIHPIFHKTKITNRRVLNLLLILWFVLIVRGYLFVFHLDRNAAAVVVTLLMSSTMSALVFMHSRIFISVYKIRRRIEPSSRIRGGKEFLRGVRDAKSCLLVLFGTICCYLPAAIENGIKTQSTFNEIVLNPWGTTFVLSASVLNSIVFYWRNKILRKEAISLLKRHWK